ncbi:MAG: hypothetical protein FD123_4184 [Bacteroidetes bacterium]|nr:MAG: hypothetical protein FD123_4184 [Bacteroidota bacterium]
MKKAFTFLLFTLTLHLSYGQACGMYRIKYVGNIKSDARDIVSIYLPTTLYLHGIENDRSKRSFLEAKLDSSHFNLGISSHLTTPYTDKNALLSYYKSISPALKIKVAFLKDGTLKEQFVKINWDDISISVIDDDKLGTLFEFRIKDIRI